AVEVCKRIAPGEAAKGLLREGLNARQYLDLLTENGLLPDAVRFLAQVAPKREAVWWACRCARSVAGAEPPAQAAAALKAAEKWAADPSEDNRRAAQAAAEAAGAETPAGCAALAAFWSGG